MNLFPNNPRLWTEADRKKLTESLKEFGDLSVIVHNLDTDRIVSGNFRSDIFDINKCDIQIIEKIDVPDTSGTVALGLVIWEGNTYFYRQVKWTEEKEKEAMLKANHLGGTDDFQKLLDDFPKDLLAECNVIIPEDFLLPENFIREAKEKPTTMKITFASPDQLETIKPEIEALIQKYEGIFVSVSCGEL